MKEKKDNETFNRVQAELKASGYREKDVTISSGKAMVLGIVYALPFVITLGLLYRFLLIERAHLSEVGGFSFYIMFIAIIAISVVIHELLHGIGWAISSGKGWKVVRFNTAHSRIYDRLLSMCVPVRFTGDNFRQEAAQAKLERLKNLM